MTMMQKPTKPCYICGSNDWWQRADGSWNCNRCHPNPNPGSDPSPQPNEGKHSPEVLALRDRVIKGNKKLNDAFEQFKEIARDKDRWAEGMERWHQANVKLSLLCYELKAMGYEDCLYLDAQGKKTVSCLSQGGTGCRVCPSSIPYWDKELMALPRPWRRHTEESKDWKDQVEFLKTLGGKKDSHED